MGASIENVAPPDTLARRALATLDNPAPADVPAQVKRVSKKVTASIDLMVSGERKKICDAAEKVGLARVSLGRAQSKSHVAELMSTMVLRSLAMAAARAGAVISPTISLNLDIRAGYVIDLSEPAPAPPLR